MSAVAGRVGQSGERLDDRRAARAVWRAAVGRRPVPDAVARRLGPEWAEGALLAEQEGPAGLDGWLAQVRHRDAGRADAFRRALDEAGRGPPTTTRPRGRSRGPSPTRSPCSARPSSPGRTAGASG